MNAQELSADIQVSSAIDFTASGGTTLTGTVDMQGFDGVMFICPMAVANAGNFIKAGQGAASNGSDASDLLGSKATPAANLDLAILDIHRPNPALGRYVTVSCVRGGADTAIGGVIAIRYHAGNKPQLNTVSGQSILTRLVSPALGTA